MLALVMLVIHYVFLVSIGLTPIKDLQQSVQTYKLGMYCKPVNFNIFLISL